ncbi:hypothetical protein SCHPADRAFT_540069 [Schizopora paradoxa]|uniref:Uncharacterized protein n=1 Tax=Schizopora paradoxa TaxID=27342 RepID=A0A0H2RKN2_9AGAM|nr:hypothetical protein SCHPADRAFT_540069 [Schizopora paradoxa]
MSPPRKTMCRLFLNGCNATFVDVTGALPDDWAHLRVCQSCPAILSTVHRQFSECIYGCGAIWCKNCRQEEDLKHGGSCVCRLRVTSAHREALRKAAQLTEYDHDSESLQPANVGDLGTKRSEYPRRPEATVPTLGLVSDSKMTAETTNSPTSPTSNRSQNTEGVHAALFSKRYCGLGHLQDVMQMKRGKERMASGVF